MFASSIYIDRRNLLKQAVGSGLILFVGHVDSPINCLGNSYPFRQDSTFLYFWGLDHPSLAAVIDLDESHETLYGQDPTPDEIVWTGPRSGLADMAGRTGAARTGSLADFETGVARAVAAGRTIHYLPPYRGETVLTIGRLLDQSPVRVQTAASPALIQAVVRLRAIKGPEEVAEMEAAVAVSQRTQQAVMELTEPDETEAEVMAAMVRLAAGEGSSPSFPPLISVKGHILHPPGYGNTLKDGDLLINDSGFESPMRYASDITRTVPVSGRFTSRQKEVYQIVLKAQVRAVAAVRPGVRFLDVHLGACRDLAEGLKSLGIMKGDPAEAVAAGAHALFFPCGLGHMLGLDVHDMEDLGEEYVGYDGSVQRSPQFGLKSLRLARALEPGFVLTVEPGLYFMPHLIDLWRAEGRHRDFIDYEKLEAYRDFTGVRIEDDVLVTASGQRVLGPPIPKTIEEIEAIRG
jgi:Xaa-Pro aminopeptidase